MEDALEMTLHYYRHLMPTRLSRSIAIMRPVIAVQVIVILVVLLKNYFGN